MKYKKTFILLILVLLLSPSVLAATENIALHIFKGKLIYNNKAYQFNQEIYNINGRVYMPIRAFTEMTKGQISYDKDNQTIYVEQSLPADKKSSVNKKAEDDIFTLHAFSSKSVYQHGEAIDIWARLSNHSTHTVNIEHGEALIEYTIIDEDGFASKLNYGLALYSSSYDSGDELHSTLKHNDFLVYNLDKLGFHDGEAMKAYLDKAVRPALLPKGSYIISISAKYRITEDTNKSFKLLEVSIPIKIE